MKKQRKENSIGTIEIMAQNCAVFFQEIQKRRAKHRHLSIRKSILSAPGYYIVLLGMLNPLYYVLEDIYYMVYSLIKYGTLDLMFTNISFVIRGVLIDVICIYLPVLALAYLKKKEGFLLRDIIMLFYFYIKALYYSRKEYNGDLERAYIKRFKSQKRKLCSPKYKTSAIRFAEIDFDILVLPWRLLLQFPRF